MVIGLLFVLLGLGFIQSAVDAGSLRSVRVVVRDAADELVFGLDSGAFEIVQDNRTMPIESVSPSTSPAAVGILLDQNVSNAKARPVALSVLRSAMRVMDPSDEFCVMWFQSELHAEDPCTSDRSVVEQQLAALVKFYDGLPPSEANVIGPVLEATRRMRNSRLPYRGLIVVSDFGHNAPDGLEKVTPLRELGVPVYSLQVKRTGPTPKTDQERERIVMEQEERLKASAHDEAVLAAGLPPGSSRVLQDIVGLRRPSISAQRLAMLLAENGGGRAAEFSADEMGSESGASRVLSFLLGLRADVKGQYVIQYRSGSESSPGNRVRVRAVAPQHRVVAIRQ